MSTNTQTVTTGAPAEAPARRKPQLSEGARAERRLGWLLCAPAVVVMIAVTAYPVGYAIWLSLQRYNLELPNAVKFVGFSNYAAVLSSPYWWQALWVTVLITVVSVSITLVLGMLLALVMYRTLFGRGTVRTAALIPYGIVTVAAAYGWQYAWTPGQGYLSALFNDSAPLVSQYKAIAVIILAEVWKTTPFMGLLLLAGLSLVPEDLQKAAKVDGATAWQRFIKITVPLMKPAILVALLFRTLDSFRIFDNIFILTAGNNGTESVSILGWDNLFKALNLGIGSAISILIFICVVIIAAVFIKGFGTAAPGTDIGRGDPLMAAVATTPRQKIGWGTANVVVVALALIPVLWMVSLSFKTPGGRPRSLFIPAQWTTGNYSQILKTSAFVRPLFNSIGIGLIATFISVVLASMAAYAVARLRFPGKAVLIGMSLLIAMFPIIALVTPLFAIERALGLFNTWPGLIIPYVAFGLPLGIYTLSAFFREIPWELEKAAKVDGATPFQAFVKVIAPLAAPGMVTTAILVFLACWNEFLMALSFTSTISARTAPASLAYFSGSSQFTVPTGPIAAAAVVITIPIILFVLFFQRRIVAGLTSGAVKG